MGCIISSGLVNKLGLSISPRCGPVRGIGGLQAPGVVGHIGFTFGLTGNFGPLASLNAIVMNNILDSQPVVNLPLSIRRLTRNLSLADPNYYVSAPVDLLLGADVLGKCITGERRVLQPGGLVALRSIFGFVVFGPVLQEPTGNFSGSDYLGLSLNDAIQQFWHMEEPPSVSRSDPQHQECEDFFVKNTTRMPCGRFMTRLPFLNIRPQLGLSRAIAEKRFNAMERRMSRCALFRRKYVEFMREYIDLDHMAVSQNDWRSGEHYYIPHHAVFKASSEKIRVVFDGSAVTTSGASLNQCLHSGPKLHSDICDVLTKFRRHQVVFVADIRMMFRQTLIHPEDRKYQLVLWRETPSEPLLTYELKTNTYGLRSSPFVAIRTLLELARSSRLMYPRAAAVLESDIYVDDVLTGASNLTDALKTKQELIDLLQTGGYELRKWVSNFPGLLSDLSPDHCQDIHSFENPDSPHTVAVLGIQYQPSEDLFTYKVDFPALPVYSKRSVLSMVARIYDPNGWVCPVVFWAKCFLQRLWLAELSWDDSLPGDLADEWKSYVATVGDLGRVALPRILAPSSPVHISLHGFCDASECGYAAVVYMRVVDACGGVRSTLILAKSKVAPIRKRVTIPKLELCGATLLCRLLNHTHSLLKPYFRFNEVFGWSDSMIVLAWLRASVHNLEVFVANRVSQIQGSEASIIWRHVPGAINPADCASRGCDAPTLIAHSLWWEPEWLDRSPSTWPDEHIGLPELAELPGLRCLAAQVESVNYDFLLNRYSSLDKFLAVTCWIRRFIFNCRNNSSRLSNSIVSTDERQQALLYWVKFIQIEEFRPVFEALKSNQTVPGVLRRLSLFLDADGLLRVGGRLRNASLPFGVRHPLLLPRHGNFTEMIIRDRHIKNSHAGSNALLATLQREFWILGARRAIRSVIFKCMPCYKTRAPLFQPKMGDLPSDRVTEARPFAGCATDFCGPFYLKTHHLRNARIVKAWGCVFVCLATKAVHLELVTSLSTEAFIATLTRFVARRGLPGLIRSDCGTNFIGANSYLTEVYKFLAERESDIGVKLSQSGITWRFSPPACPHWGGIFEAAVKSAKTHLKRVIGETTLTFEEMATVLCKIESVLNSRPLCPLSSDPNDLEVLTPGHFLVGQPLNALPEYPWQAVNSNRLSRFQLLQQLSQNFWHRWSLEYLHILQQRVKWTDLNEPPRIGDLVLLKDANASSLSWRRGRIIALHPGNDGIPRFAEVLTGGSVLKRAVATLSRLPVQ